MLITTSKKPAAELRKEFNNMTRGERQDFYQAKCGYYHNYVFFCLIGSVIASLGCLYSDYLINKSVSPTLTPRLSILIALVAYLAILFFKKTRRATVFVDFALAHAVVIVNLWAIHFLADRTQATENLIIFHLLFFAIGFVSNTAEFAGSYLLFIVEIFLSNRFNDYPNFLMTLLIAIFCSLGVIVSHQLLTIFFFDHYRVKQQLELASITDPLTQVYNRHLLEKIVTQNVLKDAKGSIAIAMLEIDHFKQASDKFGHYTGDLILLYMGQKLSNETHENDYVIRYGGEEFVVIFKDCDVNNACARMEQFRQDIESAIDTPIKFTISAGVSKYNGDFSRTIQNVEHALYKAKNSGRNKVVVV